MVERLPGRAVQTQDITSTLKELPSPRNEEGMPQEQIAYLKTLQAQINCMAWSQQADFHMRPSPLVDGSLLALGNRAGSIILMRYDGKRYVRCDLVIRIADEWITHLSWGPWRAIQPSHTEVYLACGVADGSIVIVHIRQRLKLVPSITSFGQSYSIQADVEVLNSHASDADASETQSNTVPDIQVRGEELATLRIQAQRTSIDSSTLSPVSGISRFADPDRDIVLVTLFDGTFRVVQDVCTTPTFDVTRGSNVIDGEVEIDSGEEFRTLLSSKNLSRSARATFVKSEGGVLQPTDVGRISGATTFDGIETFLWLHERCQPTDFSYKHDAKHSSMLVVARLWSDPSNKEIMLKYIKETLERPHSVLGHAPIHKLRPILLLLCQRTVFETIWPRVLELLPTNTQEAENYIAIEPWTGQVNDAVKEAFRRSLSVDLYGWDSFHSSRLQLAIADYCWSLLEGSPPDLTAQAHELNEAAKAKFSSAAPEAFGLVEPCPACHTPIALENLLNAMCPLGHVWARCSITSFVLSTPAVRTCIGCTRKAFLAPSSRTPRPENNSTLSSTVNGDKASPANASMSLAVPPGVSWVPEAGRSWIVDELLEAARCCLYCGNRFVRIL
ncbi:hypothetical protein EW145_g1385 [Phellinidium pouzarii]|uniref:Uncharacterized protein n=1 Tax=Phellinidium pouzarii TaxID=167371 RepID=A0A4S4LEN9_9AGAM|nr:hypothetical protein EW145_g1385 [Phellinidium pouzarii]